MANETEQLNLVVSLTDNATPGLAKLRNEMTQIGGSQQTQNLSRFKDELGKLQNVAKLVGEEFERANKSLTGNIGGGQQTAQLARFKNELAEMQRIAGNLGSTFSRGFGEAGRGGREATERITKFKVEIGEAEKLAKSFKYEALGVLTALGPLGEGVGAVAKTALSLLGPVGKVIGTVAATLTVAAVEASKFGHELLQIKNVAGVIGMDPAQLKNMVDQARQVGVSSEAVISSLHGMRDAIAELYKPGGGTTRQALLQVATPGTEATMERFLNQLAQTHDKTQRYNMIQQAAANAAENERRRTGDDDAAEAQRARFLAMFHVDEQTKALQNVTTLSAAQQKAEDARINRLSDFAKDVEKAEANVKQITEEWLATAGAIDTAKFALDEFNKHAEAGGFRPGGALSVKLSPRASSFAESLTRVIIGPKTAEELFGAKEGEGEVPPAAAPKVMPPFADRFGTFPPGVTALPPAGVTTRTPHTTGAGRGNIDYGWVSGIPTDVPQPLQPEPGATFKERFGAAPQDLADQLGIGAIPKGKGGSRSFDLFGSDAQFFSGSGRMSTNIEDRRGEHAASDGLLAENTGELKRLNDLLQLQQADRGGGGPGGGGYAAGPLGGGGAVPPIMGGYNRTGAGTYPGAVAPNVGAGPATPEGAAPPSITGPSGASNYTGVGGYNFMGSALAQQMGMGDVAPGSAAARMSFPTGIPAGQGPTSIQANKYAGGDISGFLKDLHDAGAPLGDFSGVYANRSMRGGGRASQHAYGNAIDIETGFGSGPDNSRRLFAWAQAHPKEFAEIQAKHHMRNLDTSSGAHMHDWGHFEWTPTGRAAKALADTPAPPTAAALSAQPSGGGALGPTQTGTASWYQPGHGFDPGGGITSSGESYNAGEFSGAVLQSQRGQFGGVSGRSGAGWALVEAPDGKAAVVKINDVYGKSQEGTGRIIDLNRRSAEYFGNIKSGTIAGMKVTPLKGYRGAGGPLSSDQVSALKGEHKTVTAVTTPGGGTVMAPTADAQRQAFASLATSGPATPAPGTRPFAAKVGQPFQPDFSGAPTGGDITAAGLPDLPPEEGQQAHPELAGRNLSGLPDMSKLDAATKRRIADNQAHDRERARRERDVRRGEGLTAEEAEYDRTHYAGLDARTRARLRANRLSDTHGQISPGGVPLPRARPAAAGPRAPAAPEGEHVISRGAGAGAGGAGAGGDSGGEIQLQHGGIFHQPTRALIGEAGPEAVFPLSVLEEARRTIDRRGGGSAVRVEGRGKLDVNVRAPPGTDASAEGSGLFRHTEMNRQLTMVETKRGPVPVQPASPLSI